MDSATIFPGLTLSNDIVVEELAAPEELFMIEPDVNLQLMV